MMDPTTVTAPDQVRRTLDRASRAMAAIREDNLPDRLAAVTTAAADLRRQFAAGAIDDLSEIALGYGLDPDAVQAAIAAGVHQAEAPADAGHAGIAADAAPVLQFPKPARRGLKLWWHGEPNANIDRTWLVEGLLPEIGTALVSGQWGTYKTFVVVDLAVALMAGQAFAGRVVNRRCGVLFIAAEGAYEIPLRLQCAYEEKYPEANSALPFAMADECPRVLDRDTLPILRETAAAASEHMRAHHGVELGLIVVDTMAAAAGFNDENDNAEAQRAMNVFTALSRQFRCLVIPVDHFGKLAETGTRGGSAKEASVDAVLAVLGDKDLSGNVTNPRMAVRKVRGAPTGKEIPFAVRVVNAGVGPDGDAETTLVIDWYPEAAAAKPPREKWPPSVRVLRDAILEALDAAVPLKLSADGPTVRAVDKEAVRRAFYGRYPAEGDTEAQRQAKRQKQFVRGLEQAQARRLIGVQVADKSQLIWLCEHEPDTRTP
jgi:hypothetical protein